MDLKSCRMCGIEKPFTEFGTHRQSKDGLASYCKPCHRAYYAAYRAGNSEKIRGHAANHRDANRDSLRARNAQWRSENADVQRACEAAYRANNPEKRKQSVAADRAKNVERDRLARAAWSAKNLDRLAAKASARRALKLKATPAWADLDAIAKIYAEAQRITRETGIEHHVDHIVPLKSKLVCGLHVESNLQIIPGDENIRKNNRHWPDMP